MDNNNIKKGFSLKEITIIIILTSIITSITTGIIVYNQNKLTKNITYHDLSKDSALQEFIGVYASLIDDYYENVDKQKMLESAISAMFNYLGEDYSTYMNEAETKALAEKLKGEYTGIGIGFNTAYEIISISKNSPAYQVGLQIGDKILNIDNYDTATYSSEDIANYIKSQKEGKKVKISILRNNETLSFELMVARILTDSVSTNIYNNHIGYLKISTFSNTLKEQTVNALNELESQGIDRLIIDLRNNTGGYLSAATDVASLFLEKGKVIYSLEENNGLSTYKDETNEKRDYKIVLILNEQSASASEVLAAALIDSYGAKAVGTISYGKGKVQQTHSLSDGSMVKYTTARWLTPNNICIDGVGITPDYYVENSINDEDITTDYQLEKAIAVSEE